MYISDVVKNISIIIVSFLLANCTAYTVTSVSTNVVSYSTTGKTNADHVISFVTGKDCKVFRVTLNKEICDQNDSRMALKKETIEEKNKTNNRFIGKIIDTAVLVTRNVAKDHAVLGAKIVDKIGLTNELEEKVKTKFENTKIKEDPPQKQENSIKEKNSNVKNRNDVVKNENKKVKNGNSNTKNKVRTWKQRVGKVKIKKDELVEEVKIQKNELIEEAKVKKDELVEEAKVKKDELVEEVKTQKNELVEEVKIKRDELVEKIKERSNELVKEAKVKRNKLMEEVKVKRKELKENFLKTINKVKFYDPDSDTYALSTKSGDK